MKISRTPTKQRGRGATSINLNDMAITLNMVTGNYEIMADDVEAFAASNKTKCRYDMLIEITQDEIVEIINCVVSAIPRARETLNRERDDLLADMMNAVSARMRRRQAE